MVVHLKLVNRLLKYIYVVITFGSSMNTYDSSQNQIS
jgi:hypothetical protein